MRKFPFLPDAIIIIIISFSLLFLMICVNHSGRFKCGLTNFQLIWSTSACGEVELTYFTVPCHTQLPGPQVIDVTPEDALPMLQCPVVKEVPLKRIIRLINNSINDLSSFPKSLMI